MAIMIVSSLVSLVCQGCVSSGVLAYSDAEPAADPSAGMTLAMPGSFGNGAINTFESGSPAGMALSDVRIPAVRVTSPNVSLAAPEAGVSVFATTPAPSPLSLTSSGMNGVSQVSDNFGWSASPALASVAAEVALSNYGQPNTDYKDVSFGLSIAATSVQTGLAFDVGLAPRFAVSEGGDLTGRRLGGEVRFGQGLDALDPAGRPQGWYVFVGADGEALVWDADIKRLGADSLSDMQMTDQLTVGDLQAGFSIQRAGGELSLSYIRREVEFSDRNKSLSDSEDFAGITFTMRR